MANAEKTQRRKASPYKNELQEARPLLQAILLGILLASGLVAAAAMATPEADRGPDAARNSLMVETESQTETRRAIHGL